ncbi:MAG TPA: Rid family detoxifying hydrolase [Bacteroidota bacterium]|nr:Rid family detoxifying hydrolase [Bacteroidota bacterium]
MIKNLLFVSMFGALIVVAGCQVNEQRIRDIVRDELSAAMKRMAILDAHSVGPYSPAQKLGNFLFVSGQIGINQNTGVLENKDFETETRQSLDNLMSILRNTGYDSTDVVTTTVYLKDIADYTTMNNIYGGYFQEGNYPARATVQVAALPRDARIEISAIAYKSKKE